MYNGYIVFRVTFWTKNLRCPVRRIVGNFSGPVLRAGPSERLGTTFTHNLLEAVGFAMGLLLTPTLDEEPTCPTIQTCMRVTGKLQREHRKPVAATSPGFGVVVLELVIQEATTISS